MWKEFYLLSEQELYIYQYLETNYKRCETNQTAIGNILTLQLDNFYHKHH